MVARVYDPIVTQIAAYAVLLPPPPQVSSRAERRKRHFVGQHSFVRTGEARLPLINRKVEPTSRMGMRHEQFQWALCCEETGYGP